MFIKYEAEVSSRVGGGERGVVDFGKLFAETNEQKFRLGGVVVQLWHFNVKTMLMTYLLTYSPC